MMAPDGHAPAGDPPAEVRITILRDPDAPALAARLRRVRRPAVLAALAGLTALAIVAGASPVGGGRTAGAHRPRGRAQPWHGIPVTAAARVPGAAGVAAAYGYPTRCLAVTFAGAGRSYARADFDRAAACGRYTGSVTAIFHRVHDAWQPVLVGSAYACPAAGIPFDVQAALGVCP